LSNRDRSLLDWVNVRRDRPIGNVVGIFLVDPTWEIGKLGAIVVLRTVLNYLLHREIEQEQQKKAELGLHVAA
jgi:uncharacterized membrane protein